MFFSHRYRNRTDFIYLHNLKSLRETYLLNRAA